MASNLAQFARRSRELGPSDLGLVLERFRTHLVMRRMEPAEFRATVRDLGFASLDEFAHRIKLPLRTVDSWAKFGVAHDTAQLLLALLGYRKRLEEAIADFDFHTNIGLADFFEDHQLP
jgi:hypothetical protein